jgi:uncharacterized membrane protein YeiB
MLGQIVALAQQRATAAARRAAVLAALGIIAAVLFLFGAAAPLCALFFWLEPRYGPAGAALIVAGVAVVLGLLAVAPLAFGRRAPPPEPNETAPQIATLVARSLASVGPRQTALAAFLLALGLGLMARASSGDKK